MASPVILDTPTYQINLTLLLSIIAICLTAMGTLIKIFGKEGKSEEKTENQPGNNPNCKRHQEHIENVEEAAKNNTKRYEELKQIANDLNKEVGILKNQSTHMEKSIDEMKEANKEVASRLDDLLKQLMDWMNE